MKILGVSFDFHDSASALLVDGQVVAAAQEERFSRIKHDSDLPAASIAYCLDQAGIGSADLDFIAYYEKPVLKFDRIVKSSLRRLGHGGWGYLQDTFSAWVTERRFRPMDRLAEHLSVPGEKIWNCRHHASHAATAFYGSPFDQAAVVTLDGVGEHETATISRAQGSSIETLSAGCLPHSLGLLYSAVTAYLGFEVNEGEYKVMGMAAYGKPTLYDEFRSLVTLLPNGLFKIDQTHFDFLCPVELPFRQSFVDWLGPPRAPDTLFDIGESADPGLREQCLHYANIAASLQKVAEEVILHVAAAAMRQANSGNLCMAGGVALNSLANGRIIRELGANLYVHPAAGDAGGALGAALECHCRKGGSRPPGLRSAYLGPSYGAAEIRAAIDAGGFSKVEHFEDEGDLVRATADLLNRKKVVGWFQGRSEWGPRALGNRSILANPTSADMQRIVNESIKFREPFRPFAPAVPLESAADYFEMDVPAHETAPEYFMIAVHRVREEKKRIIPAITHADGTARVQVVSERSNPLFHRLLREFGSIGGVPILMNTSFNLRGEPVVERPEDALNTFLASGMDAVVLGPFIVQKGLDL